MCEPRVTLWTAHGNPLKVLLAEELDETTAKGPQTPRRRTPDGDGPLAVNDGGHHV